MPARRAGAHVHGYLLLLSRENLLPSDNPDLQPWREQIFIQMSNAALDATQYFRLPPDRVVEIGGQVKT
jgi:KUP system potassium uptake protein